ncbi:hypothetical protein C808_02579 [Lachnospiraceae bacterium M18-1]|nr:hypothetical protein C808_02579 [Lachnospiraceae bacterium M18-1]
MIVERKYHIEHRILLLITRMEDEKRVNRILEKMRLPIYYQCRGNGTANSEILSLCGLRGTKRLVTLSILPHSLIKDIFSEMSNNLLLEHKGRGIAVTIPVTGMQDVIRKILEEQNGYTIPEKERGEAVEMSDKETAYSMILVAANYGYSDEIINAAHKAGAKGGTVIKGRRRGSENVMQYLGVTMQEEQEFTMIVVPKNQKSDVMVEISRACGLKTEAHGVVLAVPVEDILGIEK